MLTENYHGNLSARKQDTRLCLRCSLSVQYLWMSFGQEQRCIYYPRSLHYDLHTITITYYIPPGMCPIVCDLKKTKTKHCQTTVLNGYNKWILTTWESIQVCGSQGIFISVHKDRRVLAGLAYAFRSLAITTYSCWNNQPASGSDLDPFFKNRWTDKNVLNQLQWSNSVSEWRANDVGQTGNKKGAKAKVNGRVY